MNTNETGNSKKSKFLKLAVLLIIIVAIVSLIGFVYARYITRINGQVTAQIANYNFDVTVGNNTNLNIDLANTRLANDTNKVVSGQVAPDTKGAFSLNVNATGSNATLIYNIDLDLSNVPENLKFYSDADMKKEVVVQDNKIKIEDCIGLNDSKTKTIILYWAWPYETGENDYEIGMNDVKDSAWMGRDIEIGVSATSKQVLEKVTYLADSVNVGDYVNYDATSGDGAGLSITPTSDLTGSDNLTTFNSGDITRWRVFDVDSVTKTVRLIASEPTDKKLFLSNFTGYINSENVLNSVGAIFGQGIGASSGKSIQKKDISAHSKFNYVNYSNNNHLTNGVPDGYYFYTRNPNRIESEAYVSGDFVLDDNQTIVTASAQNPVTMRQTYYDYTASANLLGEDYYNIIFNKSSDTSINKSKYWIATRCTHLTPYLCSFRLHVIKNGRFTYVYLCNSAGNVNNDSNSVMPMITLQSNIQVTGQDSNDVWLLDVE